MSVFLCIETYVIFEYVENISGESQKLSIAWNLEIWDSRGKRGRRKQSLGEQRKASREEGQSLVEGLGYLVNVSPRHRPRH